MKKSWLLFSLSYCFLSVQAQFHTIAYSKSLYKVEEVAEQMETKSLPENGEADTPVSLISMAGKQSEEMRSHWIGCYMSVSYPLKKIIVTSPYGRRKDPFTGKRSNHKGLDLRARNEEVYAMMPGEVVKVSSDKRSGNYVAIHHGWLPATKLTSHSLSGTARSHIRSVSACRSYPTRTSSLSV